jgi:hypothetical protein
MTRSLAFVLAATVTELRTQQSGQIGIAIRIAQASGDAIPVIVITRIMVLNETRTCERIMIHLLDLVLASIVTKSRTQQSGQIGIAIMITQTSGDALLAIHISGTMVLTDHRTVPTIISLLGLALAAIPTVAKLRTLPRWRDGVAIRTTQANIDAVNVIAITRTRALNEYQGKSHRRRSRSNRVVISDHTDTIIFLIFVFDHWGEQSSRSGNKVTGVPRTVCPSSQPEGPGPLSF